MRFERFLDLIRAFRAEGVEYVLVGGVAVNLHGIVRATEDVDFFIEGSSENIERTKAALRSLWDDEEIETIQPSDFVNYPTLRYGTPDGDLVVDLLTRLGTKFRFEDLEAEVVQVQGEDVRVATVETLIRMKSGTLRPIDRADAEALSRRMEGD